MKPNFSKSAQIAWQSIPEETRHKILNNVWCGECVAMTRMDQESGVIEAGRLVLRGVCAKCGSTVGRVVEKRFVTS